MVLELIQYFFMQMVLNRLTGFLKLLSRSKLSTSIHRFFVEFSKISSNKTTHDPILSRTHLSFNKNTTVDNTGVRGGDLELLMANLGVSGRSGGEKLPEVLNFEDVVSIFEAEEPRLDEVKEAFDVFDENKDGFIDAWELHRVVCVLGFKEKMEMEDCRKMIGVFDENDDGRIDFNEFVKLMENSLC